MIYYTYAFLREDRTPYYIGKGKGNRAYKRRKTDIKPPKDKSRILILKQNLTEEEAFRHEVYMIAVFGRKDLGTGILHNRTDGGEGVSGAVRSDEYRKKLSEAGKSRTHSNETKIKMSNSQRGDKNAMFGKTHSEETRKKLSEVNKGENNPYYGKPHSEETKQKLSKCGEKYHYKIYSINEDKIYETNNLSKFCVERLLNRANLFGTLAGKRKQHKGFKIIEKKYISVIGYKQF